MWTDCVHILCVVFPYVIGGSALLSVPPQIKQEIASYKDIANEIINLSVSGAAQNQSYNRLAKFVDKFGSRIAGSQNFEHAVDYMLQVLADDKLENVHGEDAMVTHWVRGNESATMLKPRVYNLAMLGLGGSIATPPQGITAEVLVVNSFDELHNKSREAKGKIIVYNEDYEGYPTSVAYRDYGAKEAAMVGGVASLIRSIAPFSIHSPHTGWQDYDPKVKKVPTACITIEDAQMLARMAARGTKIVIHLKMEAKSLPQVKSRNTIAEIKGSKYPEQIVLISGHLDSWDVGQGAMDDGGGAFISWQALSLMRQLGLRPKRTLQMVMWTGEEEGGLGGQAYYNTHKKNISNYNIVMESDMGTFTPTGIWFTGSDAARAIVNTVVQLLKPINATMLYKGAEGTDIQLWMNDGVPGASLANEHPEYFWFHHSDGDTMTVMDPHQMDLCAAAWAVVSYVLADMEDMLPR
ncbi:carboxypeptidase Q-like [Saccoglossus kowalevskii]|uniref:Carboxypeptidase Q n=1 Tax=Saccoglossus kowalevskii TaxID=10224 RepID=A0ABM0H0B5_SACKO|nr:PREDICTED: carboxypeptidase Q-like [Saccoglossus kowalevskii]